MNFKSIPASFYPAYTWLWNGSITKEEIKRQIDDMYAMGIRAFYIIGEPENFRPSTRKTHLSPEYLSDEYVDLVYCAFETAKEQGCTKVKIGIVEENQVLRKWYETFGFVHVGTQKFEFFPFTCGYMEKSL